MELEILQQANIIFKKKGIDATLQFLSNYKFHDGMTLEEIAIVFGVSRQRIKQIEELAIKKLRHPKYGAKLKEIPIDNFDASIITSE